MSYTVKVKDLAAVALANYGVSIHASGGIRLDSSCSGARYMTHDPENKSENFPIEVYGTTVGEGTLTATLVFADDDAFEGEVVASAADAIDVKLTVKFTDLPYSVDEGDEEDVTVELSGENCETLEIPVNITPDTAESTDYSVIGLSSGSLSFSSGDTSESFTIHTVADADCDPESLELSFDSLPDGVEEGSPSTATFQINDSCPLTVMFSDSSYSVDEGDEEDVTVELSSAVNRPLRIPITVGGGTAERTDYTISGLSNGIVYVTFPSGTEEVEFTIQANQDSDCDDERLDLGFGRLPPGVGEGSPHEADFDMDDDEDPSECLPTVMFSDSSYSVDEGDEEDVTVELSHASSRRLVIPITVAPGTAERNDYTISGLSNDTVYVTFPIGSEEVEFTIRARQDNDCSNERLDLGFGPLPPGVGLGSPDEADFDIVDDEDPIDCTTLPTPTPTPFITIEHLVDRLEERRDVNNLQSDESDEFQVVASNLNSGTNYRIKVTTNHSGAQFVSDCSDRETEFPVSRVTSYTADLTLYGCDGVNPAEVKAELLVGATVIDTDTHDVIVFPAIAQPTITPQSPEKKNIILRYSSLSHNDFRYQASLFPNGLPVADTHTELFTVVTQRTITGPNIPGEYTVRIRACEDSTFANCGKYSASSNSLRKLMPPQDVDLTPHPLRKAVLSWIGDSTVVGDFKLWAAETGGTLWNLGYFNNSPFEHTITLDDVVNAKGLADEDQFTFEIRPQPVNGAYLTAENVTAVIIDTPILSINGNSSSSRGKGVVKWSVDSNAVEYTLRYRQLDDDPVHHSELSWTPTAVSTSHPWSTPITVTLVSSPSHEETVEPGASRGDQRDPLVLESIYAFQLNYSTADAFVFSARESYVWPSDRAAGGGERVATFPLHSPVPKGRTAKGVYEYHVCEETFPAGTRIVGGETIDWGDVVAHALGQWELATDGLVQMSRVETGCTNFSFYQDALETEIALNYSGVTTGSPLTTEQREALESFIEVLPFLTLVQPIDQAQNEVRVVNRGLYPNLGRINQKKQLIFDGLAREIGLPNCVLEVGGGGCAVPYRGDGQEFGTTDIFLRGGSVTRNPPPFPGDSGMVKFNTCQTSTSGPNFGAYGILVHEAGHALGIRGGIDTDDDYHRGHPFTDQSNNAVMTYGDSKYGCSPHPFDILAIYALYQSR